MVLSLFANPSSAMVVVMAVVRRAKGVCAMKQFACGALIVVGLAFIEARRR
jgi:hypothetical protein